MGKNKSIIRPKVGVRDGDLFKYFRINGSTDVKKQNLYPIVYNNNYGISFYGLERLHHFDAQKWTKIYYYLNTHFEERGTPFTTVSPLREINTNELELIHTKQFIQDIHYNSGTIADALEVYMIRVVPSFILRSALITPFKWQTSGSVLSAYMALTYGWAVNLGGGLHHSSRQSAQGFCVFADISLIMQYLWQHLDDSLKFMIIDLDAHQGNGYETDLFLFPQRLREKVYVFDVYNKDIYPRDGVAKGFINRAVELLPNTSDEEYLKLLKKNIKKAFQEFTPNLVIYNAGTDILSGDPLGGLNISRNGVLERDVIVFQMAKHNEIPIVMLTRFILMSC
ncbi:unnamed protein product, partial [Oppiella nova]